MRVFAAGIVTETNTFSPMPTGLRDFEVVRPAELEAGQPNRMAEIERFRRRAHEEGHEFVFGLYAFAQPAGITVRSAYEALRDELLERLEAAMPVDVVLLPLHGAMVADGYVDCEWDLTRRVRDLVGPDVVIGVELDLHCHLSQALLDAADLVVIYKEYPHVDMAVRAGELFDLALATAEGRIRPTMALFGCRMIGMYLTPFEPMRSFVDDMKAAEGQDGILSLSLAHGFPWGDVPDCETRMLAVTDNDPEAAARSAGTFGRRFVAMRREVSVAPMTMDAALDRALAAERGPVVVADQADNPGGGAPSDSTFVLRALLERGVEGAALAMMWDPIVVRQAQAVGPGANLRVRLGGKMGPMSGDPLDLDVTVIGVISGMTQEWPQEDHAVVSPCGDAAALRCAGVDIIVNTRRGQVFSPQVFSNFGIDPREKRLLVVKSTQHFYAGFAPIASEILYMAAPGAVAPIMTDIPYRRVTRDKFPWLDNPLEADRR